MTEQNRNAATYHWHDDVQSDVATYPADNQSLVAAHQQQYAALQGQLSSHLLHIQPTAPCIITM